jgi:hypothetical protein
MLADPLFGAASKLMSSLTIIARSFERRRAQMADYVAKLRCDPVAAVFAAPQDAVHGPFLVTAGRWSSTIRVALWQLERPLEPRRLAAIFLHLLSSVCLRIAVTRASQASCADDFGPRPWCAWRRRTPALPPPQRYLIGGDLLPPGICEGRANPKNQGRLACRRPTASGLGVCTRRPRGRAETGACA